MNAPISDIKNQFAAILFVDYRHIPVEGDSAQEFQKNLHGAVLTWEVVLRATGGTLRTEK